MWKYLGLLMTLITVSGGEIQGTIRQNILLPCHCKNRNHSARFAWQINDTKVVYDEQGILHEYTNRVKVFVNQNMSNCSLLLENITPADAGLYKCYFFNPLYSYIELNLTVHARYAVCQRNGGDSIDGRKRVIRCDATDGYPKAQIQWEVDGVLLKNPPASNRFSQSSATGLYHLSSNLTIEVNSTALCLVNQTNVTTDACGKKASTQTQRVSKSVQVISSSITAISVLLAGFALLLYCYHRTKKNREKKIMEATMCRLIELQTLNLEAPVQVTTEE